MTYIVRLTSDLHYKIWMLIEAWRCVHSVLTTALVFDIDSGVPQRHYRESSLRRRVESWQRRYLGSHSGFGIAITAPSQLYTVLSCHPAYPEALPVPHKCYADSRVSSISAGLGPVKEHPPMCPGLGT
jgi:hypothetical protein